jgi:hypothetical protein
MARQTALDADVIRFRAALRRLFGEEKHAVDR